MLLLILVKVFVEKKMWLKIVLAAIHQPKKLEKSVLYENWSKFYLQYDGREKYCTQWPQN